jgi:hypothetical protein
MSESQFAPTVYQLEEVDLSITDFPQQRQVPNAKVRPANDLKISPSVPVFPACRTPVGSNCEHEHGYISEVSFSSG